MTRHAEHYLKREIYKGHGGDRPEPSQTIFLCSCGEELLLREEGLSDPIATPDEAFQEYIDELFERLDNGDEKQ